MFFKMRTSCKSFPDRIFGRASVERNLHRPGDGCVFLVFEDNEVKNQRPVEFELRRDVSRMIDRHLSSRVPELCPAGTPWLFQRRDGRGPVDPNQLSSRLARRIRRETGLEVNAHLFRHLAVMVWLDANPGGYEAARRFLGHSELSQTLNMYSDWKPVPRPRLLQRLFRRRRAVSDEPCSADHNLARS